MREALDSRRIIRRLFARSVCLASVYHLSIPVVTNLDVRIYMPKNPWSVQAVLQRMKRAQGLAC